MTVPDAEASSMGLARGLSALASLCALAFAWVAFLVGGMSCDETCGDEPGQPWWDSSDAIQWDVIIAGGIAAGIVVWVVATCAWMGARTAGVVALGIAAACAAPAIVLALQASDDLGGLLMAIMFVTLALCGSALAASEPRRPRSVPGP